MAGHRAFEFFKPVKDDVDLGQFSFSLDHQEPLSVWGDVVVLKSGRNWGGSIGSFKQHFRSSRTESRFGLDGDRHHSVTTAIEKLPAIG